MAIYVRACEPRKLSLTIFTMKRDKTIRVVTRLVVGVAVSLAAFVVWDYMFVDRCLDRGGAWNYREFKCEM